MLLESMDPSFLSSSPLAARLRLGSSVLRTYICHGKASLYKSDEDSTDVNAIWHLNGTAYGIQLEQHD